MHVDAALHFKVAKFAGKFYMSFSYLVLGLV